jgi:hypothetical protein
MSSPNGLICFTNCLLPMQDGSLVEKDLWIDEQKGVVLDSQVRENSSARDYISHLMLPYLYDIASVLLQEAAARKNHKYGRKYCQPGIHRHSNKRGLWLRLLRIRRRLGRLSSWSGNCRREDRGNRSDIVCVTLHLLEVYPDLIRIPTQTCSYDYRMPLCPAIMIYSEGIVC